MQVLTKELTRVNEQLSQLSFYKDKLTTLLSAHENGVTPSVTVTVKPKAKKQRGRTPAMNAEQFQRIATFVGETIRLTHCTKAKAINMAIEKYDLKNPSRAYTNLGQRLTPSGMGAGKFLEAFRGTKYVVD